MPQRGAAVSGGDRVRYHDDEDAVQGYAEPTWAPRAGAHERDMRSDAAQALPERGGATGQRGGATGQRGGASGVPGRRTVTIRGRGAERYVSTRPPGSRRRPERRYERSGFRPDRAALWAVLLGVMLILAAAMSAHAATLHAVAAHLH